MYWPYIVSTWLNWSKNAFLCVLMGKVGHKRNLQDLEGRSEQQDIYIPKAGGGSGTPAAHACCQSAGSSRWQGEIAKAAAPRLPLDSLLQHLESWSQDVCHSLMKGTTLSCRFPAPLSLEAWDTDTGSSLSSLSPSDFLSCLLCSLWAPMPDAEETAFSILLNQLPQSRKVKLLN